MTYPDLRTSLFKHPSENTWVIIPFRSGIWLTPMPRPALGCWQRACHSCSLGRDFHFPELDLRALAKPASLVFYGTARPLDHGLAATEPRGRRTTLRAWNLCIRLHLAVFNWKQRAYSPVSPLGCPRGGSITSGPSLFFSVDWIWIEPAD